MDLLILYSKRAGVYATALWMMGRMQALAELADPAHGLGALQADVRAAVRRRAVRSRASIDARLAGREGKRAAIA